MSKEVILIKMVGEKGSYDVNDFNFYWKREKSKKWTPFEERDFEKLVEWIKERKEVKGEVMRKWLFP